MPDSIPAFNPYSEGALSRFDRGFVERVGSDSVFVGALSDLWTIALARLLLDHELRSSGETEQEVEYEELVLYSDDEAVDVIGALADKSEALQEALFKEPFGFAPLGTIERVFREAIGPERFDFWMDAFEREDLIAASN